MLVRALIAMNLLIESTDGELSLSSLSRDLLSRSSPNYIGHMLRFHDVLYEGWSHLEHVLRSGRRWHSLRNLLDEDDEFTQEYIAGMMPLAQHTAPRLAKLMMRWNPSSMLDIGCGPGAYSLAMIERVPGLKLTLFDLPTTLKTTERFVRRGGTRHDITLRAGDYLSDDLGEGYDLALLSHVTHDESAESLRKLFVRTRNALREGGRICIHGWLLTDDDSSEEFESLFSLQLMTYTDGRLYSREEYERLLHECGYRDIEYRKLENDTSFPTHAIWAVRS